jgi:hypothetical protein
VVSHWKETGSKGVQKDRADYYNKIPFAEILPWYLNSSEGAQKERFDPEVGADFRGPGEKK